MKHRLCSLMLVLLCGGSPLFAQVPRACGVLVMAHGGSDDWNAAVEEAVAPLRAEIPTAVAFGMADPATLQAAVASLEGEGVDCVAVVRLFMSAHSFLHQTEYLLGLRADPPPFFITHGAPGVHHGSEAEDPRPLSVTADLALSREGLLDAFPMGTVLAQRALSLSDGSGRESVIVIAHGPGDDDENEEWLRKLDRLAGVMRATGSFRSVEVHTLREDWEEKRTAAERRIRASVDEKSKGPGRVLIIPFRLFGFGPYADVLDGLSYEANGMGLLPSPHVTEWIRSQALKTMSEAGWPADVLP